MQTHRFYLPPENCRGDSLHLDEREAHHALHVLRLKRGDEAVVLDGAGNEFVCSVENTAKNSLTLAVKEKKSIAPPPCSITLLVGIPKGKIIESIIQKSVELGARRLVPLLTERVVTRLDDAGAKHKQEQWQQVAVEAIKQCGAHWLPEIATPVSISEVGRASSRAVSPSAFDLSLVGSLQTERRHPREIIRDFVSGKSCQQSSPVRPAPKSVAVWIGPEGDFTPDEMQAIIRSGAQPISLGNLTLRVETAAIYCLSILNYELNR